MHDSVWVVLSIIMPRCAGYIWWEYTVPTPPCDQLIHHYASECIISQLGATILGAIYHGQAEITNRGVGMDNNEKPRKGFFFHTKRTCNVKASLDLKTDKLKGHLMTRKDIEWEAKPWLLQLQITLSPAHTTTCSLSTTPLLNKWNCSLPWTSPFHTSPPPLPFAAGSWPGCAMCILLANTRKWNCPPGWWARWQPRYQSTFYTWYNIRC